MNQIFINDNYKAFGEMSVKQYKSGGSIIVEGILQLNQYFDDIVCRILYGIKGCYV